MFVTKDEAREYLNELGIFRAQDRISHTSYYAFKTSADNFQLLRGGQAIIEKVCANVLEDGVQPSSLVKNIEIQIFKQYDAREEEIANRKDLIAELQKEAKGFLGKRRSVICKDTGDNYYVVDLDKKKFSSIAEDLIADKAISKYSRSQINLALNDLFQNKFKLNYQRQLKLFEGLGIKYAKNHANI